MRNTPQSPRPASICLEPLFPVLLLTLVAALAALPARAHEGDTLRFEPVQPAESEAMDDAEGGAKPSRSHREREWLQDPFHQHLLSDIHRERLDTRRWSNWDVALDYNRVDDLRFGLTSQAQADLAFAPRLAVRLEYATGRERWLYGAQLEQPVDRANRFALGVAMSRATDHLDLNQVEDFENSLALLFGRQDYRDYFEREGVNAYAAARWPAVTTLSAHIRSDRYRSLKALDVDSWFHRDRTLRTNPPIADGDIHAFAIRLEQHARRAGGFYHWIELEHAGDGLGGDFHYRRALADLRSVVRLSPAMAITLRAVGGSGLSGALPPQRTFTIGGVDGLRGHSFGAYRGDQVALGQAEYAIGFGEWGRSKHVDFEGLHAIVFVDAGSAWSNPDHDWDPGRQHYALDGGFGLGTDEDNLRIYFAKDLRDPDSDFVISARLRRPF